MKSKKLLKFVLLISCSVITYFSIEEIKVQDANAGGCTYKESSWCKKSDCDVALNLPDNRCPSVDTEEAF